jgi:DNA-binding FadR family transcriptional regulator
MVKKNTLVEQIALQLRKEIFTDKYHPGSEFPSEKELALRFQVSTLTVRSALKKLAHEGLIEISQGKKNIVNDYRLSIGIDIFPELLVTCPDDLITHEAFNLFQKHIFWLYDQILVETAKKATPELKPELREKIDLFLKAKGVEEVWNRHFDCMRECLKINKNVVLMMYFNSYIKTHRRLMDLGMINETVYPIPNHDLTLYKLIDAICANDLPTVRDISWHLRPIVRQDLNLWFKPR